jgi:hypothetical protein
MLIRCSLSAAAKIVKLPACGEFQPPFDLPPPVVGFVSLERATKIPLAKYRNAHHDLVTRGSSASAKGARGVVGKPRQTAWA